MQVPIQWLSVLCLAVRRSGLRTFLVLSSHSYSCLIHLPHILFRNHGPDEAYKNMYPLKIQTTASLLSSSPSTAALLHRNPVSARIHHKRCSAYYNTRKTLLKLLYTNTSSEMGCLEGSTISNWTNQSSINMEIKIVHKHGTADCKPNVHKTSSVYCSTKVQWNEWQLYALNATLY
jgi:hypothetical protein